MTFVETKEECEEKTFKKKKKMLIYIFGDRGAYMQNNIDQAVDP